MDAIRFSNWKAILRGLSIIALIIPTFMMFPSMTTSATGATLFHAATFVENDNSSDQIYATQTENSATSLTLFSQLTPSFVDTGFTFTGWNTASDGSGTPYSNGETYSFATDIILYAMWVGLFHPVTFVENDNASDGVFTTQTEDSATPLTLFSNLSPVFVNQGFTFAGWNTASNGSGISYSNGEVFAFLNQMVLYAQWVAIPIDTASFDVNGGSGSLPPVNDTVGSSVTLPSVSGIENPGYTFVGWNTEADGSGTEYAAGASYTLTGDQTLYAQWIADVYVVTYEADGGTSSASTTNYTYGTSALVLPSASLAGSTFDGWYTSASGGTLAGLAGSSYTPTGTVDLYAQWTPIATETLTFDANGGIGSISVTTGPLGSNIIVPSAIAMSRAGYVFTDWNTASDGSGLAFSSGVQYVLSSDLTFYAQWVAVSYLVTYSPDGGVLSPLTATFTVGSIPLALPTPAEAGATFDGWFTTASGGALVGGAGASYTPTTSVDLYAQWTEVVTDTLTFDANGGSGVIASMTGTQGTTITLPGQTGLLHAGYILTKWNTVANGSGTSYAAGQSLTLTKSSVLFAQWSGHAPATLFGAVGVFPRNSAKLSASLKNQVEHLALVIRSKQYKTVTLYGYTAPTGLVSVNLSLSRARAVAVASYLRARLSALRVGGVVVKATGEGAVPGQSGATSSRVEVFVD